MSTSLIRRQLCLLLGAAALGTGMAHADQLDTIMAAKKIRVAIDMAVPPYSMKDDKLKLIGNDVETAELLAKDLGLELEFVPTVLSNRVPFLQTGKADIVVASLSVTPEREKVIDFSVPYAQILAVVAGPKGVQINGFDDLKGKRVATTRGSNNDKVVTTGAKDAQVVRYDDDATLVTAAVSGQADIIATSPAIVSTVLAKAPQKDMVTKFTMSTVPLGIGMRKDEPALKAWINDWITKNLANGKLQAIYKKYHGG